MSNTFHSDDLYVISATVTDELDKVEKRVKLLQRIRREVNVLQRDMSAINMLDNYDERFCSRPGCLNVSHYETCSPCAHKEERRNSRYLGGE